MNAWLASAGVLLLGVAGVHSWLGERLMFNRVRGAGWVPTEGGGRLREPHLRILWATWHLASIQAGGSATVLFYASQVYVPSAVLVVVMAATFGSGLLVLVGTRGRHPGWIGLWSAAMLMGMGLR